jgi:tetratricopeptide (TPR) repeat protein
LLILFLSLTFLLGIFPLKDADIYWHLRTGDIIRGTGEIPRVDFYTFTCAGRPWIDVHWLFQVGVSWLHDHGGVPAMVLAKSVITVMAMFLLVTARKRSWPVWMMVLAWLPALMVLGGRMYVRPETLSLLYLSVFLAAIFRWQRFPWIAWLLPPVQVVWVNSHGLFVLGPVVLGFGLIDSVLRRGAFAPERKRWWQIVVPACVVTGLACLLNPYGVRGAIFPLELAGTMSNPIFSHNIAELTPISMFIQQAGLTNLPLQIHLATMALGAVSFLVPLTWSMLVRLRSRDVPEPEDTRKKPTRKRRKKGKDTAAEEPTGWRLSPFRLLLFAAFSLLSLQATRNSHQFAAVVGTITAWNFAEWIAVRRKEFVRKDPNETPSLGVKPRLLALLALGMLIAAVGSGEFYRLAGEGRTVGLGEEPLFFPHEACMMAGGPGMPDRFLSYHNAHSSLFEYYHSPEREGGPGKTVFTDPRLEIGGPEIFDRYLELGRRIRQDQPGWSAELDHLGRPTVLVDHVDNAQVGATLLSDPHWRCVWFDPIAAVFVHDSYADAVAEHEVDFAARHFEPEPASEPHGLPALNAAARGLRNYVNFSAIGRGEVVRPMIWLGLDYARRIVETVPDSPEGWKTLGQIETLRDPLAKPTPRCRMPLDPVFDLSLMRATYAFRRAYDLQPDDFMTLLGLQKLYEARQMNEEVLPVLQRLVALTPINQAQRMQQGAAEGEIVRLSRELGAAPESEWKNLAELEQQASDLVARGRVRSALERLEGAYPAEKAPWEALDRMATFHLHLGDPARARALWQKAVSAPNAAVRHARIAMAYLIENRFDTARRTYEQALAASPDLFEARYGLAILEQDAGRAQAAYRQAVSAIECAPDDVARSAARAVASAVSRFARPRAVGGAARAVSEPLLPERAGRLREAS